MEFVLQPGRDFSCAKRNKNKVEWVLEAVNYEEGSGRSRVSVCACGRGGGDRRDLDPPKFIYPSELSIQYLAAVNCHEIDTR